MKITINDITYESTKLTCGVIEGYFDVIDLVEESEKSKGRMSKTDRLLIKEFLCNAFGNQFTTEDIDNHLEFSDLIVYFRAIGEEVSEKTKKKFEKLAKK